MDSKLLDIAEIVRAKFGRVKVNSGHRCKAYNRKVGGSKRSQHLYGRAADIVVPGVHPDDVAEYLDKIYPDELGLGMYDTFTHFDTRNLKARWDNRT